MIKSLEISESGIALSKLSAKMLKYTIKQHNWPKREVAYMSGTLPVSVGFNSVNVLQEDGSIKLVHLDTFWLVL